MGGGKGVGIWCALATGRATDAFRTEDAAGAAHAARAAHGAVEHVSPPEERGAGRAAAPRRARHRPPGVARRGAVARPDRSDPRRDRPLGSARRLPDEALSAGTV